MIKTRSMYFVALVIAFVTFSAVVASGVTFEADDAASRYFKSTQGNPAVDAVMITVTSIGDVITMFIFGTIITIIRRTRKAGMIFLIALVAIVALVMYIKPLVGRHNPPYTFEPAVQLPKNFTIENDSLAPLSAAFSYPSGHAARATALTFIIGYVLYQRSRKAGYVMWTFPVMIGITRLYLMQHYPTDIIGGFLFGAMVSVVLVNAMKLDQPFFMSRFKQKDNQPPQSHGNL